VTANTTQAAQLSAMKAIGITEIRLDANWDWVQYGGPGTFDWSQLDQAVASVRAAGMSLDLIIDGCPPWAALCPTTFKVSVAGGVCGVSVVCRGDSAGS